ncbi:hypothetical protein [Flavobacterium xinjiangense]|uniref:Outer membrane protein beta-barrel domain-containing protein n=1 Tax=Flavobacterium xinjiangense TaxID=178356 RepID=A0A1M7FSM5_9FLAO|nr:hypothetical protein [Flavobacterium xinjiangense]SHM06925.1 hypothetical protein SAMN05216269_102248 [Flavobacterium xinjiangense]
MKKGYFIVLFFCVSFTGKAQITKNNWLVGGEAGFFYNFNNSETINGNNSYAIHLSPNIGYFIYDKLAAGSKFDYIAGNTRSTTLLLGPFLRYYFLEKEKRVNLFLESSYNFGLDKQDKDYSNFSTKVGTAIFLNSSVALELALNYNLYRNKSIDFSSNSLSLAVGFQIHLEKEK